MNTKLTPRNKMTGFAMRGGIDIDENEMMLYPEANYWARGARGAANKIRDLVGCSHEGKLTVKCRVDDLLENYWRGYNSWMKICLETEHTRDLIKALVNKGE